MTKNQAILILKNAAFLGTEKDIDDIEKAIESLEKIPSLEQINEMVNEITMERAKNKTIAGKFAYGNALSIIRKYCIMEENDGKYI